MADTYVQQVDLSPLIREVRALSSGLDTISKRVEAAGNKIDIVEAEVTDVRRTVNTLVEKFAHMLNKQEKSYAATEVVRVRQELEKKFGHYETVRKNMLGILQANDLALVKEDTISQCSEELMLAAPGYWLAPALVALAAWISDNPTLANRAVREAVKRDEEKTYLLFALICRRAGRLEASSQWLGRYFSLQDAHNMKDTVVNMIDAYSNKLFGDSRDAVCEDSIDNWMREIKMEEGFMQRQIEQWTGIFESLLVPVPYTDYAALRKVCEESEGLLYAYARVNNMHTVLGMFVDIMNAADDPADLIKMVDRCLYNLVKNYDAEEYPLKQEEEYYQEVINWDGDIDRAKRAVAARRIPEDRKVNFAEQLSKAAITSEDASNSFRKTSLKLLEKEKVISTSFKAYARDTVAMRPQTATFHIDDWRVRLRSSADGKLVSADATVKHYNEFVDKAVAAAKSTVKPVSVLGIAVAAVALILMIVCAVYAMDELVAAVFAVIFAIAVVVGAVICVRKFLDTKKKWNAMTEAGETQKKEGEALIRQAHAEYVNVFNYISADSAVFGDETYQIESLK